jgi:folate-dependent tRNA-U54 methylase TrmFO/GidA
MSNPGLIKSKRVEGDVNPYRFVKHGSADGVVAQGAAATDALCGVSHNVGAEDGGIVDVIKSDITEIEYGGTVAAGDPLTSDAEGKAIKATVSGSRVGGYAEVSAVAGDIADMYINLGILP